MNEEFLITSECTKLLKRTPGAVRNLVLRRKIPFRKPGGRLIFLRSEIEKWIEKAPGLRLRDLEG
ncbi:MAG TPA: DNA-binding protein [Desulfobacterales bacterium]|nr:DNA-binding protein [Desulfobacterales bacterium]